VHDTPLGQGMVTFEPYFRLLHQQGFSGSVILHCEYPLGGAEHGATTLEIPRQLFSRQVGADLALLRHWLAITG
jgi:sugar phosphate isomerase/epimerase